jgi:hypothetical protein
VPIEEDAMRRQWMGTVVVMAVGAWVGRSWADAPPPPPQSQSASAPVLPQQEIVNGAILQPLGELPVDPVDGPFPIECAEPVPQCPRCNFYVYSGAYLLQPAFQTNPAFLRSAGGAVRQSDFSQHMIFTPLAGLGFTTQTGWGMRTRWYNFAEEGAESATVVPGQTLSVISPLNLGTFNSGSRVMANSNVKIDSWDVEGTYTLRNNQWSLLLGGGVRYLHMSQDYAAILAVPAGFTTVQSGHNFNGAGPTFSMFGRLPLREGRIALYGNLVFSALFGDAREDYSAITPTTTTNAPQSTFRVLPVGELEVGAEYNVFLGRRARMFIQSGFVGQIYWGAGNASNVDPFALTSANNTNLGMLGVALRAGLSF